MILFLILVINKKNICILSRRLVKTKVVKFQSTCLMEEGFVQALRKKWDHDSRIWGIKDREPQHIDLFFLFMSWNSTSSWPSLFITSYMLSFLPNKICLKQFNKASYVRIWVRRKGTTRVPELIYGKLLPLLISFPWLQLSLIIHPFKNSCP